MNSPHNHGHLAGRQRPSRDSALCNGISITVREVCDVVCDGNSSREIKSGMCSVGKEGIRKVDGGSVRM